MGEKESVWTEQGTERLDKIYMQSQQQWRYIFKECRKVSRECSYCLCEPSGEIPRDFQRHHSFYIHSADGSGFDGSPVRFTCITRLDIRT